jgi:hypothetical protein
MILKHARWERFAQLVAKGESGSAAYRECYGAQGASAEVSASRLLRNVKVRERISDLQAAAGVEAVMSLREMRLFLAAVVRTPIGSIDEHSPLCQSFQRTQRGFTRTMVDKLRALELDARLAGWLKGNTLTANVQVNASENWPVLTEERRAKLIELRRAAMAWQSAQDEPMALPEGAVETAQA